MLHTVRSVTASVRVPVAVKLSPFHTAMTPTSPCASNKAGAAGLVLFNRFYQPDFNIEDLEVVPHLKLSDSSELLMRLRWLAIISPNAKSLARVQRRRAHRRKTHQGDPRRRARRASRLRAPQGTGPPS
jgi:hypothetical protein